MTRRYAIYIGFIALLAAINLGRWWLHGSPWEKTTNVHSKSYAPEDFLLRADSGAPLSAPRRDLFDPAGRTSANPAIRAAKHAAVVAEAKRQTPAVNGATEEAGAELARFKLLGVVFRAGAGQAYLGHDRENVMAHSGDTVYSHFVVDNILVDAIDLRDLKTNLSRRIPISGK
jgi:hypothetical protein